MQWTNVGDFIKSSLPILGTALLGSGGGIAGKLIANAMGVNSNPEEVMQVLKSDPNSILKYKLSELETNREILIASFNAQKESLEIVNKTMRSEHNSNDPFVRRWRPFYGYAVGISWAIQMLGITFMFVYVAIAEPKSLAALVAQLALLSTSLAPLWGIALAVLGVSVHKRSQDKLTVAENQAKGFLAKFINK